MNETSLVIQEEVVQTTALSVLPTMNENALTAVHRQLAVYKAINTLVDITFKPGVDFDDVTGKKNTDENYKATLLLPGIEKVMGLLGLTETFHDIYVERHFDPAAPFFYYEVECILTSVVSGQVVARGQGVCHTREKSFMRQGERTCPLCGKATIRKSNQPPKNSPAGTEPGWYCWRKLDGCGAEFGAKDTAIISQQVGNIVDSQLVWDGINRARKIANKRAKAEAVKRIGMLSNRFTVDLEDDMRYSDAELASKAPPLNTSGDADAPAGDTPPPAPDNNKVITMPQQQPHWSKDPAKMKLLIEAARKAGYIEATQGETDLLKLLGKEDWASYKEGKDAKAALEGVVKALHNQPTPPAEAPKPAESKPSPFTQYSNGTGVARSFIYANKRIVFKLEDGRTATWFKGRGELDKALDLSQFEFAFDLLTERTEPYTLPIAVQVGWQNKARESDGTLYAEAVSFTVDKTDLDAWFGKVGVRAGASEAEPPISIGEAADETFDIGEDDGKVGTPIGADGIPF